MKKEALTLFPADTKAHATHRENEVLTEIVNTYTVRERQREKVFLPLSLSLPLIICFLNTMIHASLQLLFITLLIKYEYNHNKFPY